jgi:hypothetical protein
MFFNLSMLVYFNLISISIKRLFNMLYATLILSTMLHHLCATYKTSKLRHSKKELYIVHFGKTYAPLKNLEPSLPTIP